VKTIVVRTILGLVAFYFVWMYATAPFAQWFDGLYTIRTTSLPVRPISKNFSGDYQLADWLIPVPASTPNIEAFLAQGNDISLTEEHSILIWPTPFEINFISGHSASYRRYTYYRLFAKKPTGQRLEMVWRYIQPYMAPDGWIGSQIGDGTGLIRIVQDSR
jgi:hypothetical protein